MKAIGAKLQCLNLQYVARTLATKASTTNKLKIDDNDILSQKPPVEVYKRGRKHSLNYLVDYVGLKQVDAMDMLSRCKQLGQTEMSRVKSNYQTLCRHCVSLRRIIEYPKLLTGIQFEQKIKLLEMLPYSINDLSPLLLLSIDRIETIVKHPKKIEELGKILEATISEICEILAAQTFLITLDLEKIERTVRLLRDKYGITTGAIKRDISTLKYRESLITERLDGAIKRKLLPLKLWMVRAPEEVMQIAAERRRENTIILAGATVEEFLSKKLQCTKEELQCVLKRLPPLEKRRIKLISEIFDFLYSKGFTPQMIYRHPKILLHSLETTKKRIEELERENFKPESLYGITKSQRQYRNYFESVTKNKSKKH